MPRFHPSAATCYVALNFDCLVFHRKKRSVTVTRVLNYINSYVSEIVARTIRKCDNVCTPRCDKNASASKSIGITSERYLFLISSVKASSAIELILFCLSRTSRTTSIDRIFFITRMSKQSGKYKYPIKEDSSRNTTKEKREMGNVYYRFSNFTSFSFFFSVIFESDYIVYEPSLVSV